VTGDPCTATRHGDLTAYNKYGCRCDDARRSASISWKRWQLRVLREGEGLLRDPTGVARRLRALAVCGWSVRALAAEVGATTVDVGRWQKGEQRVHVDSLYRIAAAYERLRDEKPPGERPARTRNEAARKGWVGPDAWDDDTIDDPGASPRTETVLPQQVMWVEDVEWLVDSGEKWAGIVERLGVQRESIRRALDRHGRQDLLERLRRREAA
jgi:transcriptional regulator with XRE-family HTH domain